MALLCPKPSVLWLLAVVVASSPAGPEPGDPAAAFSVPTLGGEFSYQPGAPRGALVVHAFSNKSGFLECMWSSESSLASLVEELPDSTHVLFLSLDDSAVSDALWMREQLQRVAMHRNQEVLTRLHFSPVPVSSLGNWIPDVVYYWRCCGRGCGFSQVVFNSEGWNLPIVVKRLDARYDWLMARGEPRSYRLVDAGDGCGASPSVAGALALVSEGNCSFFTKVHSMARSNASGVLVYALPGNPIRDMNCVGGECDATLAIPAAMVHREAPVARALEVGQPVYASFQDTPAPNFFIGIDHQGALAEMGWFTFPSFSFLNWQAQWFDFDAALKVKLQSPAKVISVFDKVPMLGERGAVATVDLPIALRDVSALQLDASLSCPGGGRDASCGHWDRAVRLLVCCAPGGPSCGAELGRWVTAFRRGTGRWLTDVTPLVPLLDGGRCTLSMKTVPWAMPWVVSLNLRFSVGNRTGAEVEKLRPFRVTRLYSGGTFDKSYNGRYRPTHLSVPPATRKVELYAVITAHGYDDNGCGEFCVTSHHFLINGVFDNTLTFHSAGTPLGCTLRVKDGAVPNQHGTWLYGRGGWCDGLQVDPWRTDVTRQMNMSGSNAVLYFGLFRGKDPDPSEEPGYILMSSFLVFYK